MAQKIRAGAVSYLNTKPLIYGFEQGMMKYELELIIDYPANIARFLQEDKIDIGLVPVAIIPTLKEHYIISDYCIGCDGEVVTVCLFSDVPLAEIETILLDYQSRTSVELLKILLKEHWKISPELIAASENFEENITGKIAGLVIGDRAFIQRKKSAYNFDLGLAWKEMTGLPFVFAAWVSNKKLNADFTIAFNKANEYGLENLNEVIRQNPFNDFDLQSYYTKHVKFNFDAEMQKALTVFFEKL